MSTFGSARDAPPGGLFWQLVVEAGLGAVAVGFLYWSIQAGFYGAFGVGPAEAGIDAGTPTELVVGYAYVGAGLAAALVPAMVVVYTGRGWRRRRRVWLPVWVAVFLIAGLGVQA